MIEKCVNLVGLAPRSLTPISGKLSAMENGQIAYVYSWNNGVNYDVVHRTFSGSTWDSGTILYTSAGYSLIDLATYSNRALHVAFTNSNQIRYATNAAGASLSTTHAAAAGTNISSPRIYVGDSGLVSIFYEHSTSPGFALGVVYGNEASWTSGYNVFVPDDVSDTFQSMSAARPKL
jgi:hypothetical protein